jgi:hypothetical protein
VAGVSDPDHQENPMGQSSEQPTSRQLRYLRVLAERTGTTFVNPSTRREASREIRRLHDLPSLSGGERRRERQALERDRERLQHSSAIQPDELSGYGSHARWAKRA